MSLSTLKDQEKKHSVVVEVSVLETEKELVEVKKDKTHVLVAVFVQDLKEDKLLSTVVFQNADLQMLVELNMQSLT